MNNEKQKMFIKKLAKLHCEAGYRIQETCENLANTIDEFKCSECGFYCDDTNSCKKDDDGEIFHYDFQFKYCPKCGAKVVEK